MASDSAQMEKVVDRLYEAAARPELWRPVLHELALATGSQGAQMLYHRPSGAALHTSSEGLDDVVAAFFREGWNVNNPRELRARRRRVALREVITDADLFTPEELDDEPWQKDFLDRFGLRWFSSFSAIPFDEIAPVILTIERQASREPFARTEVELLQSIVPHVQRAGQLSLAVAAAAGTGLLDGLDRVGRGAILLDDLSRVVSLNHTAERLLGNACFIHDRRLLARDRDENVHLQRLLTSVTSRAPFLGAPAPAATAISRLDKRPLILQGTPLVHSARDFFQQARALIMLLDLDQRAEPNPLFLSAAFDLSPAEVKVAQALANGGGTRAVATRLMLSVETIGVHLKSIFLKTGTHSQSDLAVMLDRVAGPRAINKS